jgi:oligopeptide/dipeptide ABC transporter ATP-binding protein
LSLLKVRDLNVYLRTPGGPVNVVSGLDFDILPGSVFGLAGESGCGKSLTALSIMGILPPTMFANGSVRFRGKELLTLGEEELRDLRGREISMVFQEPMTSLNPVMRVGHQIREVLTTHLNLKRKEADRITLALLRDVRIPSPEVRAREYPHQMSGGMRQRIMVAMAMACSPSMLIADEPTTALDVTIEAQLLELLMGIKEEKGMAVLLITHDLGVIAENAERVAVMYAGRLVEVAGVRELFEAPRHPYTMGLLRSLPRGRDSVLRPIPGTVPKPGHLPPGCKFSDRCGFVLDVCRAGEPDLMAVDNGGAAPGDTDNVYPHLARCIRAGEVEFGDG